MSFTPQTITLQQETRASDGAGGKTSVWATVGTYQAEFHLYKRLSEDRLEKSLHRSEGPGVQTKVIGFFKIPAPYPTFIQPAYQAPDGTTKARYQIVDAQGVTWQVDDVRPYDWTLQIDVKLVE